MRRNNAVRIQEFADDLRNFVETPGPLGKFGFTEEKDDKKINKILKDAVMAANMIAAISKEIEFYVQGDINKTTFLLRYEKLEKQLEAELAQITE